MKKFLSKLRALKPTKRRLVQLYTALLFNANLKGFKTGNIYKGDTKIFCAPGINCYSCPGAVAACPLGSLQGSFSADKSTIFYVVGIILLYGLLFGRWICGWLCPFGLIQELLHKIKTPKIKKGPVTRILSFFKYIVLVFFVFIVPITYAFRDTPLPAFCKYICPAGTLEGGIGLLANKVNESYFSMLGPLFTWKFMLLVSICVGSVFVFRLFCRFICPLGALYGLFNRISLFGVKVEPHKCTNCGMCVNKCPMDIATVGDAECISCGKCMEVCPTDAIVWKGPFRRKKGDTPASGDTSNKTAKLITRLAVCLILLGILAGSVVYHWNADADRISQGDTQQTEYGNQVGDLCFGEKLQSITPSGISDSTLDPTSTGKITVINFWGTWCTPCVNELPYFDRIATDYADKVSVFAIHTDMVSDTAPEYIGTYYPNSKMTFLKDLAEEKYYALLGGRGTYPYTVILNSDGTVSKIFFEALHYEDLDKAIKEAK